MMMLHQIMEGGEDRGHGIDRYSRLLESVAVVVAAAGTECGSVEFGVGEMVFLVWKLITLNSYIYIHCGAFAGY